VERLKLGAWLSSVALGVVIAVSKLLVPRKAGHTAVKAVMGLQFVGLLGYLVSMGYRVGPSVCRINMLVFAAYAPGLVCYVLKRPKSSAPPRCPKKLAGPRTQALAGSALVGRECSMSYEAREAHAPGRLRCTPPASPTR
jgi:hypothetical protein